jgi:hypothetical protein
MFDFHCPKVGKQSDNQEQKINPVKFLHIYYTKIFEKNQKRAQA